MKLIYLDIDGVLCTHRANNGTVFATDIEGKHWFGIKGDWEIYRLSFERTGRILGRCLS